VPTSILFHFIIHELKNVLTGSASLVIVQIPVRPFRHNEYERFIKAAYPYYGGTFSMVCIHFKTSMKLFLFSFQVKVHMLLL
jgi:hypothetical protein